MNRLTLIFFSAFCLLSSPVIAKDGRQGLWIVSQLSGDARVVHGGLQRASLKVNTRLSPGDVVVTGQTGRATLSRDTDYIVLAPRSELRLPFAPEPTGFTRVIQSIGTMLFKVKRTGKPHFAVDTPMLAAVVKGTTFTIVVDRNRSAVQVTEGIVEVSANDGGMKKLVEGGNTVFINHNNPKTLMDADTHPSKGSTTSSGAVKVAGSKAVSLAALASLTSGLVRPEVTPTSARVVASTTTAVASPAATTSMGSPNAALIADATGDTVTGVVDPVVEVIEDAVTDLTEPVVEVVEETVNDITEPVVDIVEDTVTGVVQVADNTVTDAVEQVMEVIGTTTPEDLEPVTEVVETTVPEVTEPVVDFVETIAPEVTEPVVELVDTTVPEVTEPVVDVVETIAPEVTEPVVELVETTVPEVTAPVVDVVETVVPAVPEVDIPVPAPTLPIPW